MTVPYNISELQLGKYLLDIIHKKIMEKTIKRLSEIIDFWSSKVPPKKINKQKQAIDKDTVFTTHVTDKGIPPIICEGGNRAKGIKKRNLL